MGFLLKFRIPGVQRYIFQTPNLKEIRGASAILEDLCDNQMKNAIETAGGTVWFMAAGFGAVTVDSRKALKDVETLIQRRVVERSRMLRPQFASLAFDPSDAPAEALRTLDHKMQDAKPQPDPGMPLHTLFKSCQSCRRYPLVATMDGGDNPVCAACAKKRRRLNRKGKASLPYWQKLGAFAAERKDRLDASWHGLWADENLAEDVVGDDEQEEAATAAPNSWVEKYLPAELSVIGERAKRPGYIALVYADANQLGQTLKAFFEKIRKSGDAYKAKVEQMRDFSQGIDRAMRESTYEAIFDTWQTTPASKNGNVEEITGPGPFPFDILYLGGDDLMFVCPADKGPDFAQALCRRFSEQVAKNQQLAGLTLSVGLVFAKYHTPMSALLELAKELLKSAKRRSFQTTRNGDRPDDMTGYAIDFAAVTDTSVLQLKTLRKEINGVLLSVRPCDFSSFQALLDWAEKLNRAGVRATRLMPVLDACRRSRLQGTLAAQALIGRMDEKHREPFLEVLKDAQDRFGSVRSPGVGEFEEVPWLNRGSNAPQTMIGDLVELSPFLELTEVVS